MDSKSGSRFDAVVTGSVHMAAGIAAASLVALLLNVVFDVTLRNVFNSSIRGTLEYVTYWWMPLVVFLGLGLAEARGENLRVSLLIEPLDRSTRGRVDLLATSVGLLVLLFLAYYSAIGALESMQRGETAFGVTSTVVWPFRWVAVLGLLLLSLQTAISLKRIHRSSKTPGAGPGVERPDPNMNV